MRGNFRSIPNKNVQMLDHFFPLLFPKDSESLKIFDIQLREVGAKRPLNGTSKVNRQTNTHTDRQTDGHFNLKKALAQRADALKNDSESRFRKRKEKTKPCDYNFFGVRALQSKLNNLKIPLLSDFLLIRSSKKFEAQPRTFLH